MTLECRSGRAPVVATVDLNSGSNGCCPDSTCVWKTATALPAAAAVSTISVHESDVRSPRSYADLYVGHDLGLPGADSRSPHEVVVKGIVTRRCVSAVSAGADAVTSQPAAAQSQRVGRIRPAQVVAAVNGCVPVMVDRGFRRGTDIFKALAIGADACLGCAPSGDWRAGGGRRKFSRSQSELSWS
jgi:hypothetical protein